MANRNDLDRALADENESIQLDPTVDQSYLARAFVYGSRNETAKALADYETLLHLNPDFARAYIDRGALFARGGDLHKAIEDFRQAIRSDPRASLAYLFRAQARISTGDKAGALEDMDAAIRIEPRNRQLLAVRNQMRAMHLQAAGNSPNTTSPPSETSAPAPSASDAAENGEDLVAMGRKVNELIRANRFGEALPIATNLQAIVRQRYGEGSRPNTNALALLANVQKSSNHLQEAARNYETVLSLYVRKMGTRNAEVAATEVNLGQAYLSLSRFDDAERLLHEAVAAYEALGGPSNLELGEPLVNLSDVFRRKAQFAEAERLAKRAYEIWDKAEGPEKRNAQKALRSLADIYQEEGRLKDAGAIDLRVISDGEKEDEPDELLIARTSESLGVVYHKAGRFPEAEKAYAKALAIYEKIYGPDDPATATQLSNLAVAYSDQRKDHEAEVALNRALLIREKAFGPDSQAVALILADIAGTMAMEGRDTEAAPLLRRSLAIFEKTYGPDHPDVAHILGQLAAAVQGDADEATRLNKRALAIQEKVYGPNSPETASALLDLGADAGKRGQLAEAQGFFVKALAATRAAQVPKPSLLIGGLEYMGDVKLEQVKPAEAEAYFREALGVRDKAFGKDYPASAELLSKLAHASAAQGHLRQALEFAHQAVAVAVRSNERLGRTRQSAATVAKTLADVSQFLAQIDWDNSQNDADQRPALANEAFLAAQRTNLSSAASALASMSARFGAGDGTMAGLVREQQDLGVQAQTLDKALADALGTPDDAGREAKLANVRAEATSVDARLAEVGNRIARDFPTYVELSDPKPLPISDVQALLASDEVLVTWLVRANQTFVWAITKYGNAWQAVDLTDEQLSAMVAKLRGSLDLDHVTRGLARGEAGRDLVFDLATANTLYEKLLAPVAAQLVGKKTIVEVPIGALTSLPLQVLMTDKPHRSATSMSDPVYRDAPWLAKSYAVTVIPSVSSLQALRVFTQASTAPKPLAGFADPVFSRTPTQGGTRGSVVAQRKIQALSHYYRGGAVDLDALRQGLPALPETADELKAVAHDLSASAADLKIGEAATVAAVKAMPLDQYRVVYFATHGLVAGDVGGLTEPALALTIPAHPTEADSGLLTASDVGQLKLNADWVVLSACNTAAGDKPGAEGLSGLTRAFFYAGARALLVSNWSVRSDTAVDLTTHTFAKMTANPRLGRSEALRQSMLELMASGDDHAYPAVWAPFVVVGEGGRSR